MPCIEPGAIRGTVVRASRSLPLAGPGGLACLVSAMWLSGCGTRPLSPAAPPTAPSAPVVTPSPVAPPSSTPAPAATGAAPVAPGGTPGSPGTRPGPTPSGAAAALPSPARVRSWEDYRAQAARRMVAAHPSGTYMGRVPEPLLAIPVLEVELHADGHVRDIRVLRQPGQARDTVQLAIDAVRRAAPFGPVDHLPRPWRFAEAFLFDDTRRFKPRSLD